MSISNGIRIGAFMKGAGAGPPAPASLTDQVRTALFGGGAPGGMWDATDSATLSQDAAGTMPVTAHGQPIGRLADLSGNGNHLVQTTAVHRPTWTADGAGFDGVDDRILCVGSPWVAASMDILFSLSRANSQTVGYCHIYNSDRFTAVASPQVTSASSNAGTPSIHIGGVLTSGTRADVAAKWATDTLTIVNARNATLSSWTGLCLGYYPNFGGLRVVRRGVICPMIADSSVQALVEAWVEGV